MTSLLCLGGRFFTPIADLAAGEDCSWHLVREEADGARFLLQRWKPRPTDRELDKLRETFLQRFTDAESVDPQRMHFGFDDGGAWFLQGLQGTPLSRLWSGWSPESRARFVKHLRALLAASPQPRFAHPDAVTLKPGRVLVPRRLGATDPRLAPLEALLPLDAAFEEARPSLWEDAPELSDPPSAPIRGRAQELTYLKSLTFGFTAPTPMERVVLLQAEDGLGQEPLEEWAAATAETEGLWVLVLEAQPDELPGALLARILRPLVAGVEADLYARNPDVARLLARRIDSFAFLRGGGGARSDVDVLPDEIQGALEALEFASEIHPRLLVLRHLERLAPAAVELVGSLVAGSRAPWLLSVSDHEPKPAIRALVEALHGDPNATLVSPNRLEDVDLRLVLADLLVDPDLPGAASEALCRASLGNPGLLRSLLEMSHLEGNLRWQAGRWSLLPGAPSVPRAHENLVETILAGRVQRLSPSARAAMRLLALAHRPLDASILGRALDLSGDALEDAIQSAAGLKLARVQDATVSLAEPAAQELLLVGIPRSELQPAALALLRALEEEGRPTPLNVRLLAIAIGDAEALGRVMAAVQREPPNPLEAERMVHEALQLGPDALQRSRLWEFLADAWGQGNGIRASAEDPWAPHPLEQSLEALGLALVPLEQLPEPGDLDRAGRLARLLCKKALLESRLHRLPEAHHSIQAAAAVLADHPLHPGQAAVRLALGRVHLLEGFSTRGIRALEEGLQMASASAPSEGHGIHAALLAELGCAQAHRGQFQRALANLQSAQRLQEHGRRFGELGHTLIHLGQTYAHLGQPEPAYRYLREALQMARMQGDAGLQAECHLSIGSFRSSQQLLGDAVSHLDRAIEGFSRQGNRHLLTTARVWKARTLAALGDSVQSEFVLVQALAAPSRESTPLELGDYAALQGDIASIHCAWRDASRLFLAAAGIFEGAGLLWRERLARLRHIQAEASEGGSVPERVKNAWESLMSLKAPVEGMGSLWLDLEWHKAHALLLSCAEAHGNRTPEALLAWGEVLSAARTMRFPALVLEASAAGAALLLENGERLGARSRLQDAFSSYQEIWSRLPEAHGMSFLGRSDMHRFRQAVEASGLRFILPERVEPLADWTPTQATQPPVDSRRGAP